MNIRIDECDLPQVVQHYLDSITVPQKKIVVTSVEFDMDTNQLDVYCDEMPGG